MKSISKSAAFVGLLGIACAAGCAEERAPINRVQAAALAKSFYVGDDLRTSSDDPEFYMRRTIIDVGYGAGQAGLFTSTYAQPVSRIKWEITENLLNARLSYERVASSDGKGNPSDGLLKKTVNDGQIVASYRVLSHFDIRRTYNPATGEEQNVIEENASDRPWYAREYFRVDWSQNLATASYDLDTLASLGWSGGVEYESLAYTVLDPNDPDAPHFDPKDGYFDVTNKAFAKPALIDVSSLGQGVEKIPACMLPGEFAGGTQPYGDCSPVEITIRQSFRKVVDRDYEPMDLDGMRFQAFGAFTTERVGYARDYGMTDAQWHRFADRYNIWHRSHYYKNPEAMEGAVSCATRETTEDPTGDPAADPNRDLDKNGTADECEAVGAGSRCDVFSKKCTLPYRHRASITIPWYVNGASTATINSLQDQIEGAKSGAVRAALEKKLASVIKAGEDLFEATNWAVEEWDLAMKTAIQTSRLVECRRTGGAGCEATYPMWIGQQEDIDEAVTMARDLDACRRKAALGDVDPGVTEDSDELMRARKSGWTSEECASLVSAAADALAAQRGDPGDVSAAAMKALVPSDPVIVLCHNPVMQGDHPACGPLGLSPRLGDIRYNTVLAIDKPQEPSAWGIMVDADDPLTGEKVAASINIWTHVTDIAAQSLVDIVRYMNGDLATRDITEGTYITNWAKATALGQAGAGPTMSRAELDTRVAAATDLDVNDMDRILKGGISASVAAEVQRFHNEHAADVAVSSEVASPAAYEVAARMRQARGTPAEAELINTPMLDLAGIGRGTIPSGAALDQASPLALNNPRVTSQLSRMREAAMAARGACVLHEAPEASSVPGIADMLNRKFPAAEGEGEGERAARYDAMLQYIRRRYHYAVIAHEMGHSVGLRHNFVSSYAAVHFRPQYWQLRTKNGAIAGKPCSDAVSDGSACVGPRYWDPMTDEEQSQAIGMFQQSSAMDYPGDVSQDMIGIGTYDFAATRLFYGDVVSVYDVKKNGALDPDYLAGGEVGVGITSATDTFGGLTGIQYAVKKGALASDDPNDKFCGSFGGLCKFHYSQLQRYYKLIHDCRPVSPEAPSWWREDVDGRWDPLFDGGVVSVDGAPTKCRTLPVDYMGWTELRGPTKSEEGGGSFRGANAVDPATKRLRVPYSFATDHWADTGNTSVFRHDSGADPYEQAMFLITTQENRHIFDNYRRGRSTFSIRAAADRSFRRYNEKLLGIASGTAFLGSIYRDFATSQGLTYDTLWPLIIEGTGLRDNIIAGTVAFDHFTRELSRPEPGEHYFSDDPGDRTLLSAEDPDGNAGKTALIVPNGATGYLRDVGFGGHPLENRRSESHGDFDSEYITNVGAYYEKINVATLLSASEDRFISQSRKDFYDARFRAVGMADVFSEGFRRVIANALTDDKSILAPHVTATNGAPDVTKKSDPLDPSNGEAKLFPKNPIGWTSFWPNSGPVECFSRDGANVCANYTQDWSQDPSEGGFKPERPADKVGIDPQIGWEVQKFLIAWTAAHISANQRADWIDTMRIFRVGHNGDPGFEGRIEWQDPTSGELYIARTYGKECLFGSIKQTDTSDAERGASCAASGGRWVQRGIAARVLEYANELTAKGYKLDVDRFPKDPASSLPAGFNQAGRAMVVRQPDGGPVIAADPTMKPVNSSGGDGDALATCDNNVDPSCKPLSEWDNRHVVHLKKYKAVPNYLFEIIVKYGLGAPHQLGLSPN